MTITKRKNKKGKWVYDNQFMYHGERYKKCGFARKSDAESWEADVKSQVNQFGYYYVPCKKTFIEVYEEAFEIEKIKKDMRPNTISTYNVTLNIIRKNKICAMTISNITYRDIQSYYNSISGIYGQSTCCSIRRIFNLTFQYAMQNQYIKYNPNNCTKLVPAKKEETNDVISYDDFMRICDVLVNKNFYHKSLYIAMQIGYYTGARISEVLALEKKDIDFCKKTININKQLSTTHGISIEPLKTKSSYAELPLAAQLEEVLKEWFEIDPYDILICHENGEYVRYSQIWDVLHNTSKKLGIDFHFHMLRHAYTSNIVSSGVDIKTAQTLLRHADVTTTLNVYAHSDMQQEHEAIAKTFENYPEITPILKNVIN